jgi:hypothetical protein
MMEERARTCSLVRRPKGGKVKGKRKGKGREDDD